MLNSSNGWRTEKVSRLLVSLRSGTATSADRKVAGEFAVYGASGEIGRTDFPQEQGPCLLIGRVGSIGALNKIQNEFFWASDNTLILKTNSHHVNFDFFFYAMKIFDFNLIRSGMGQPLITGGALRNQRILLPSLETQHRIVDFLDKETARIDTLVDEMETMVTLLQEERKALISETVKQEGKMEKVSRLLSSLSSGSASASDRKSEGLFSIYGANGEIGRTNQPTDQGPCLLIGRVGSVGALNKIEKEHFQASDNVLIAKVNHRIVFHFFVYAMEAFDFDIIKTGMGHPLITGSALKNQRIPLPSLETQYKIVKFLNYETRRIDNAILQAKNVMTLLKEERKVLINDVVTGKLEV